MRRSARRQTVRLNGEDGYTLTEMLVVIGIICLIAAVLTPGILIQLSRARAKAAQLQLDTVSAAVEMFHSDVGRYPTKEEGLKVLLAEPAANADGWTGPYLKDSKAMLDPWGKPVIYVPEGDSAFYVETFGADGKPGGSGADRDLRSPAKP